MYTEQYIKQLQSLHGDKTRPQGFGGKTKKLGKFHDFMKEWNPSTLLDYGCGKGHILAHLTEKYPNTKCSGYDPAIPMFNNLGSTVFDCVFSNDVLEHIEPQFINEVLQHIDKLATKFIWLRIDTLPARKKLPDGRNAHLILEQPDWWRDRIQQNINGTIIFLQLDKKGKLDVAVKK
jgi:SAM-dependent methyltransferase